MSTRLLATVMLRDVQSAAALLREPPPGVDYLELRFDALVRPTVADVRAVLALPRTLPVVATCRAASQGGLFAGDDAERLALLTAAGEAGADLLDIEDANLADFPASVPGGRIASCHLSRFVPRLDALAARLARHDARFGKLAVPAETPARLVALLELQSQVGPSIAIVPTGRLAEAGRVLAAARGSPLTYGAVDPDDKGHPDQPDARRLHDVFAVSLVNEGTRFYAVVGTPVAHSLSPDFHNTVLRGVARNARMVVLDADRLGDVLEHADALRLDGMAITHPFKHDALQAATHHMPGAATTGAANTLVRSGAGWQARNTDWRAACDLLPRLLRGWRKGGKREAWLERALRSCWKTGGERKLDPDATPTPKVLLLGAGGAARAVAVALVDEPVELLVWSRRPERARALANDLIGTVPARAVESLDECPADLVVNATPVGMPGVEAEGLQGLGPSVFAEGAVAVDLVYLEGDSPFRAAARAADVPVVPGSLFFVLQARRQAEIFAGASLPAELRRQAAARCGVVVDD